MKQRGGPDTFSSRPVPPPLKLPDIIMMTMAKRMHQMLQRQGWCVPAGRKATPPLSAQRESSQRHCRLGANPMQLTCPFLGLDPLVITYFKIPLKGNMAVVVYRNLLMAHLAHSRSSMKKNE